MPTDYEVNRDHIRHQRDVGMRLCGGFQRLLHRPAGGVVDMHDPPPAVPAFTRQMPVLAKFIGRPAQIERHAQFCQSVYRLRGMFDDKLHRFAVVEAAACHHGVVDMAFKGVTGFEHRRNPALRPRRCAVGQRTFRQHRDFARLREL